jgi:poly(3-hydroxybutyrate) depolymerase
MNEVEKKSYEIFKKWAKSQGLQITKDYTLKKKEAKGYDFEAKNQNGEITTYEVKGSKHKNAIPDLRDSEFENKKLKADFLFVVGNIQRGKEVIYKIPRDAIKPENLSPKKYYFIRRFQNKKVMEEFIEPKEKGE